MQNNIANPRPYQNDTTSKIISVEVTDELRNAALSQAKGGGVGLNGEMIKYNIKSLFEVKEETPQSIENVIRQNAEYWEQQFYKWQRLFDTDKVKEFLNEEGKAKYDTFDFGGSKNYRYVWLYKHLDFDKFTKLSATAENYLAQGYVLDPRNTYFNENGEIESHGYNLPDEYNGTISRLQRDNTTRRVFGFNSPYNRSPEDIKNGTYPGWKSSDVTYTHEAFKNLVVAGDGVRIIEMKRESPVNDPNLINEGLVLEIDAANTAGYQKTVDLIKKVKEQNLNVVSYRIRNMGENDTAQKFKHILKELPDNLLQVELYFSARATNTGSLIELENKSIKELSLFTLGNSLLDEWSINPLALRKTQWINTNDYNVSRDFGNNVTVISRITFDTLAFDEQDYNESSSNPYERINLGLRLAYYTRNNEPFFQGGFGPGLNADHNEGGNSYPTGLDFGRVPKIKSLKGLEFRDIIKDSNAPRKIWRATFYNNNKYFEIGASDLENPGLENFAQPFRMMKPKIKFTNGQTTVGFKISENLTSNAIANLVRYKELVKNDNRSFPGKIQLAAQLANNEDLKNRLQSAGFEVEIDSGFEFQ
ncbi:putative immunoglobulin-blocking virulence protein [Mycoplasmopsis phocirhinis]|uniref:Putative immunoglobulin-blocking virulence protein n=1 Tax=Mycoplasmopsis phocirhinis TaxID=142650 RepID=A0A4P6MPF0_9BACT|nr:putative immunoglobulin-blocking virulence protein [Mycoplasmopsis phocirhinis]